MVLLDVPPLNKVEPGPSLAGATLARSRFLQEKGVLGMITIIRVEREKSLAENGLWFDVSARLRFPEVETGIPGVPADTPPPSILQMDVRHDSGAALLGLSRVELDAMFTSATSGRTTDAREMEGRTIEIRLGFETRRTMTPNVVGWIEGSDANLKKEYIVIGAHHDHNPMREGRIYPGADDDGSGTVAMLSLAQALLLERPKRSVIFVWNTAEEKGLIGAYYFVQHCPVPVEKITRLVYLTCLDIGNRPEILKLDLHPEITTRGPHNMKIKWQAPRPLQHATTPVQASAEPKVPNLIVHSRKSPMGHLV